MTLEYVANDCVCGFPAGQNPANCERCKLLREIVRLRALLELEMAKVEAMIDRSDEIAREMAHDIDNFNLEELLQYCRISNQRPTVEGGHNQVGTLERFS